MNYIILKSDGSKKESVINRYIQQGNNGVDKIFIGWPLGLSTDYGQAVFTLPNQLTNTELGVFKANYPYEADDPENPPADYDGETCNGWVVTLTSDQTTYNGGLFVSFRVIRNGIVQVAFPFTLMINETGVRPDTDSGVTIDQLDSYLLNIQNLVTGAVRQNTDAALSPTSENPVQNKVISAALEAIKRGSYTKVDTTEYPTLEDFLDSEGEEGFLYLYPVDTSDESEGYYQYIWENDLWIPLGTTKIDIANMVTTDTSQTITAPKTFTDDIFAKLINFGNNATITKDSSNRIIVSYSGTVKAKFGGSETIFATKVSPDQGDTYDLGRSGLRWNYVYANYVSDGTNNIAISDIAKQGLVASQFDETVTYTTGDLVIYQGTLYKMTSSIYVPGQFLPSLFTETSVANELANAGGGKVYLHKVCLKDQYANKIGTFTFYRSNNTHLTKNEIAALLYNNNMYDFTSGTDVAYSESVSGSALKMCPKLYASNATTLTIGYRKVLTTTDGSQVSYSVSTESVTVSSISDYVTIAM